MNFVIVVLTVHHSYSIAAVSCRAAYSPLRAASNKQSQSYFSDFRFGSAGALAAGRPTPSSREELLLGFRDASLPTRVEIWSLRLGQCTQQAFSRRPPKSLAYLDGRFHQPRVSSWGPIPASARQQAAFSSDSLACPSWLAQSGRAESMSSNSRALQRVVWIKVMPGYRVYTVYSIVQRKDR